MRVALLARGFGHVRSVFLTSIALLAAILLISSLTPAYAGQKPPTPTGLAESASNAIVTLTWNASSGATSYNVKRSATSGSGYATIASPTTTSYTDTSVTNGTTYYYVVSAVNSSGESADSSQVSATPIAPPSAPTNLSATSGNTQVSLTWTASGTATGYNIKRSSTNGSGYSTIGTSTSTSYTNKAVSNTLTYYYVVTATNAGGESGNSNQATGSPTGPPSPPLTFTANGGYQQVGLSWSSSPSATSYNLYRSTTSGAETLLASGITGTSYTDSGLPNTTKYYYKIAAVGSLGTGLQSSEVSATTFSCAPPPVPSNVTATPHGCEVDLLFYVGTGSTFVDVYRGTSPTSLSYFTGFNMAATGPGYYTVNDTTATNGVTYYYAIDAEGSCSDNSGTISALSSTVSATAQAPAGASNITAIPGNAQVAISWCNDPNAMQQGYDIERFTTSGGPYTIVKQYATTDNQCHTYTDTGLTNGTTYYYVIAPYSNCGTGAISAQVSAKPQPPPAAPTGLSASVSGLNINLSWTASSGATSYNVKRATVSGGSYTTIGTSATTSYTDGTALPGTPYYYVVSAVSSFGESANSSQVSAHSNPASGTAVYRIDTGGPAVAPFAADQFFSAGSTASTSNNIDTSGASAAAPMAVYETQRYGAFNYVFPNLAPSTAYTVRLHFAEIYYTTGGKRLEDVTINGTKVLSGFEAYAAANGPNKAVVEQFSTTSDASGNLTVQFAATSGSPDTNPICNGAEVLYGNSAPLAPVRLAATAGNGHATLSWTAYGSITSYNVKRSAAPGGPYTTVATGVTTTSYTNTGLTDGTLYYYVVTAVNSTGESANSNEAAVRPTSATPALQINCGGPAAGSFVADTDFSGGSSEALGNSVDVSGVPDAAPAAVYSSRRYDFNTFSYSIPGLTANASYTLRLHFAELYAVGIGQRLENVSINGTQVLTNFDTTLAAGGWNKAVVEQFNTTADSSGKIAIVVSAVGSPNYPQLMGIEIVNGNSAPSAPIGLTAFGGNAQVSLLWHAVSGATTYNVYRSTTSGGPYTVIASGVTSISYADTSVTNGTTYYYIVTAVNASGESYHSGLAYATPVAAGAAQYRINCGDFGISPYGADQYWSGGGQDQFYNNSIDTTLITNPAPVGVYQSRHFDNSGFTYTFPNLTPGATYTARLHFCDLNNVSPGQRLFNVSVNGTQVLTNFDIIGTAGAPNKAIAIPIVTTADSTGNIAIAFTAVVPKAQVNAIEILSGSTYAPGPPLNLTSTAGSTQILLKWTAATGGVGTVTYNVKRSTVSGGPYTVMASGVSGTSYSDPVSGSNNTYYYVVSASDANGESINSNQVSGTPTPTLQAPTISASASGTKVNLSWNSVSMATSYNVKRATSSSGPFTVIASGVTTTSYADTTASNGTTYYYTVCSVDTLDTSVDSNMVSVTIVPAAPTGLAETLSNGSVVLTWGTVTGATSYNVKRATTTGGPYTTIGTSTSTTYTDSTAAIGTAYYYVVTALNTGGESGNSNEVAVTPILPPKAPANLIATGGNHDVTLTWTAGDNTAQSWNIKRASTSGGPYTTIQTQSINTGKSITGRTYSYIDVGVTNGATYYYVVSGVNYGGEGANSTAASATPSVPVPHVPGGLKAAGGNGKIVLGWRAAPPATSYNIQRAASGGVYSTIATGIAATSYTDVVPNGTTYSYEVSATDATGTSAYTAPVTAAANAPVLTSAQAISIASTFLSNISEPQDPTTATAIFPADSQTDETSDSFYLPRWHVTFGNPVVAEVEVIDQTSVVSWYLYDSLADAIVTNTNAPGTPMSTSSAATIASGVLSSSKQTDTLGAPTATYIQFVNPATEGGQEYLVSYPRMYSGLPYRNQFAQVELVADTGVVKSMSLAYSCGPPSSTSFNVTSAQATQTANNAITSAGLSGAKFIQVDQEIVVSNSMWQSTSIPGGVYAAWVCDYETTDSVSGKVDDYFVYVNGADGSILGGDQTVHQRPTSNARDSKSTSNGRQDKVRHRRTTTIGVHNSPKSATAANTLRKNSEGNL